MDYKDENNREEFEIFKERAFTKLRNYINDINDINYKKSALITYWINSFANYLKQEETFDSTHMPVYKQGSIVEVDLGFNIGSEQGGLHYAIVINKNDNKKNPILTIIPLSSIKKTKKKEDLKAFEVYLGNEIYLLMFNKLKTMEKQYEKNKNDLYKKIKETKGNKNIVKDFKKDMNQQIEYLKSISKGIEKIEKLKIGSYAITNQITTISKMRVKNPIKDTSHLSNLIISDVSMDKIKNNLKKYMKF